MKAAVAAKTFAEFDHNKSGTVSYKDLVGIFGKIKGISVEQAQAIATTVMNDAFKLEQEIEEQGADGGSMNNLLEKSSKEEKGINFASFMTCLEGSTLDFDKYLKHVAKHSDRITRSS